MPQTFVSREPMNTILSGSPKRSIPNQNSEWTNLQITYQRLEKHKIQIYLFVFMNGGKQHQQKPSFKTGWMCLWLQFMSKIHPCIFNNNDIGTKSNINYKHVYMWSAFHQHKIFRFRQLRLLIIKDLCRYRSGLGPRSGGQIPMMSHWGNFMRSIYLSIHLWDFILDINYEELLKQDTTV